MYFSEKFEQIFQLKDFIYLHLQKYHQSNLLKVKNIWDNCFKLEKIKTSKEAFSEIMSDQGAILFIQNLNKRLVNADPNLSLEELLDMDLMKSLRKLESCETSICSYILLR